MELEYDNPQGNIAFQKCQILLFKLACHLMSLYYFLMISTFGKNQDQIAAQ